MTRADKKPPSRCLSRTVARESRTSSLLATPGLARPSNAQHFEDWSMQIELHMSGDNHNVIADEVCEAYGFAAACCQPSCQSW